MNTTHYPHWPAGLPYAITTPDASVYVNLEVNACRFPNKPAIVFYDSILTYAQFNAEVEALAGHLQKVCGVQRGDRILLDMQNSPQFMIAYYAIMRADAMAVPVNPMLVTDELRHYGTDSGAKVVLASQEVFPRVAPLIGSGALRHAVVATYSDYLTVPTTLNVPEFMDHKCFKATGTIRKRRRTRSPNWTANGFSVPAIWVIWMPKDFSSLPTA